jgi:hypothetical protein
MTTPQLHKKKLQLRVGFDIGTRRDKTPAPPAPGLLRSTVPSVYPTPSPAQEPSMFEDFTFEDYKAANFNVDQQYDLIGRLRHEVPPVDRDEIDSLLLADAAKQLEMCIFPMCKMMHVDPKAVKRMLDEQFRKSYGSEIEEDIFELAHSRRMVSVKQEDNGGPRATSADDDYAEPAVAVTPPAEPAQKKPKLSQPRDFQKVVLEETAVAHAIARMLSVVGDDCTNGSANADEAPLSAEPKKTKIELVHPITAKNSVQTDMSFTSASAWQPSTPNAAATPSRRSMNKKIKHA